MPLRPAATLALLLAVAPCVMAQGPSPSPSPPERDATRFRRRPASGRYVDPESRFSLQGYVTGTYADFQEDFTRVDFPPPGQLLVPRTDHGSFQYDWALFIGSRLSESVRFVVETHFVTRGDGDFHPDIVTTEAQVSWMPLRDKEALRLALGQFWAPFSSVNDDWFSAVNVFAIVPFAARAFPLHYNERGLLAEGAFDFGKDRGLNYALSLGNGVSGMSIEDQHGFDTDGNKTLMGRVGLLPLGSDFEVGVSGMSGDFRQEERADLPPTDPRRFPASFKAAGVDARYARPWIQLRAYGIRSTESLQGSADLDRWGIMTEGTVRVIRSAAVLREVWAKARWDRSGMDMLGGGEEKDQVFSLGLSAKPDRRTTVKAEGFFHQEKDGRRLRDNGFVLQVSASF